MISAIVLTLLSNALLSAASLNLAVSPQCGSLTSFGDLNAGLKPLSQYRTFVSFGDSSSQTGTCNGPVWNELLAQSVGATSINYANGPALADHTQYPGFNPGTTKDFQEQIQDYAESAQWENLNADTTLYVVFFGQEDFVKSQGFNSPPPVAISGNVAWGLSQLASYPFRAKHILVVDNYGRGQTTALGDQYRAEVFQMLDVLHPNVNVGFVNFGRVWKGVFGGSPGHAAFGYTNTGTCVTASGTCSDPGHTFYWSSRNPTAATHGLLAEYTRRVLAQC